jgi:hypothetical protein
MNVEKTQVMRISREICILTYTEGTNCGEITKVNTLFDTINQSYKFKGFHTVGIFHTFRSFLGLDIVD